ncbi:hypothetical protein JL722_4861 [Aureococcus anophagefferens]|nr:hypothetical protein JL722_4861 [Aureococcus anophagefferens]
MARARGMSRTSDEVLAPPNPRWREYIDVAIDIDAASTVIRVIKKHPGNEAVLMASTRCLSRLAVDATNATIIGEEGGVDAVLESMAANDGLDQEVLLNSLSLIDKMCNHPKSLEKIVHGAHDRQRRQASIAATKRCSDEDAASVIDVAKVLIKLIGYDDLGVAASLKSKGALNTLLGVLGVYPTRTWRASSRSCSSCSWRAASPSSSSRSRPAASARTRSSGCCNCCPRCDGDFADEIAKSGGILAVIGAFEGNISARAMEEIVRLIGRLALSSTNLDDILSSGAIEKLVFCLRQPATPVDLKAQILGAFNKISTQANTTAHVARCPGAVDAIVGALAAHGAESGKVAREGCKFLAALLKEGDGAEAAAAGLTTSGLDAALAALVAAMRANADDVATQLAVWKSNLQSDFNVIGAPATGAEAVRVGGGLDAIVAAVCAHPDDASVRKAAIELVESLSNDALVAAKVAELRVRRQDRRGRRERAGGRRHPLAAMALGVLAMVPANVPRLAANDAATPMVRLMGAVASMKAADMPHVDELLGTFAGALVELEAGDESGAFPDDEALAAAVAVVKNHAAVAPSFAAVLETSAGALYGLCKTTEGAAKVGSRNGPKPCIAALGAFVERAGDEGLRDDGAVAAGCWTASGAKTIGVLVSEEDALALLAKVKAVDLGAVAGGDAETMRDAHGDVGKLGLLLIGGALPFICAYVSDNMAEARAAVDRGEVTGASPVAEAIRLLANLAAHGDAETLLGAGTLKVIEQILDALGLAPDKESIEAVVGLMKNLAERHAGLTVDMVKGTARKLLGLMNNLCSLDDVDLAVPGLEQCAELLELLAMDADTAQRADAADVLIRAAQESEIPNFKGSDLGHFPLVLGELAATMRLLGNLVLQPGLVDQAVADRVMQTIVGALDQLYALAPSDEQQDAIAATLALLSRLMNVEGVVIPEDLALHCLQGAFGEGMGDALKAAACATLGSLARAGRRRSAIARCAAHRAASSPTRTRRRARGGDGGLAGEAASALSTLLQQALSHAAELAADPRRARRALLGGVRDRACSRTRSSSRRFALIAEDLVPDGGDGSPGAPIDVSEGVPAARALAAADLIAKAVAHGDADANNGLVHYDLPKAMVNALKSKLRRGEEPFVQNDLYALNGMADTLGVEAMKLSKEAIRLVTDTLTAAFAGGAEEQLEERLNGLAGFHAAAADWQCIASADGAYFFNGTSQESAWEQPQAHFAFMQELGDLVGLVDQLDGDLSGIDPSSMAGLVGCLATHSRDAGVLGRLDKMKARLGLREYVAVLNQTALDHMANGVLVLRCLTILGHLAFNNDEVIGYEMEVNVPYTLKWALQQHILDAKLVEIAVFTCSSLLTENEEQKAYVCDQLTPEFVEALKLYAAEASFFTKTMRCMGNMSIVDACILTMTAAGSVPLVVAGMDVHMDDSKVLRTAVELFSNFGATEDDDMDEQATTYLIDGGAIGAIKKCVKLISVLTYNEFSVERLTAIGTTAALLSALAAHANDEEFVVDCMLSLSNLVTVPENARVFLDKSHLKVVFELLDVYDGNAEVVKFVLITLSAVSAGGIKVLLNTMETFDDDPELIIKTVTTLDNLVSADMEYAAVAMLAQKEKGRTNRAALFARLGDDMDASKLKTERLKVKDVDVEPTEDPLKKFRESLKNGIIFKEWKDGKAVSRKLLVGEAFDSVLTREAPRRLCFVVKGINGDDLLCGESKTKADAAYAKEALETMLNCASKWPHRLVSG